MVAIIIAAAVCQFDVYGSSEPVVAYFDIYGTAPIAAPKAEEKPVATITVDVWERGCSACVRLKKDVANYKGLKFVYRIVATTAPVLHWKVGNVDWKQEGWTGLLPFIDAYNASLKPRPAAVQTVGYRAQTSLDGSYAPPIGDLIEHLHDDHGYRRSRLRGMSYENLLALHDYAHRDD